MDWLLILKVLGPVVVAIAIFIEVYKKKIKKDKFNPATVWKIAAVLSFLFSAVGVFFLRPAGALHCHRLLLHPGL